MYDISQSYYPLVLEMRETAVEINESLEVYNNRVVLTEIPDTYMKVYLTGFTEVEDTYPQQGEYVVDYKTGIVTFGGELVNNVIVQASYYGKGIIQYPAQRIYSHNDNPDVAGNLQKILDRGAEAVTELNKAGDLAKRTNHSGYGAFFGNNDWTRLIYKTNGTGTAFYNETVKGVEFNKEGWHFINVRIPIEPDTKYRVIAKVKKSVGDGAFYLGAVSLDNDYNEINTDQAGSYNYFGAKSRAITSGNTEIIEGVIGGYNTTAGTDHNKFDPEAKYFNLVIITNYGTTHDISKTVLEWMEIYRSPKELHVQGDGSFGGSLVINGQTTMYGDLDMNNKSLTEVKAVQGQYGKMIESRDEWLRINDDGTHTSGTYFGSTVVRTDGQLQVGSGGSVLLVRDGLITYKGNNIGVADGTLQANLNADMLDGLDQSVFMRKSANSDLVFANVADGQSYGLVWTGLTDTHSIFVEESNAVAGGESTHLVIYSRDNGTDGLVVRNTLGDVARFIENRVDIYKPLYVGSTMNVSGAVAVASTLNVIGVTTLDNALYSDSNIETNGKVWISKNTAYGSSPLLSLTIGDADTGIDWISDGHIIIKSNSGTAIDIDQAYVNIHKPVGLKSGVSVTGNASVSADLSVSGNTILVGTLDAGNTTVDTLNTKDVHVAFGNSIIFDGGFSSTAGIDMMNKPIKGVNSLTFNDAGVSEGIIINWAGTNYQIDVGNETRDSNSIFDHMHFNAGLGNFFKFWQDTKFGANILVKNSVNAKSLVLENNTITGESVTFETASATGLRATNQYGYVNMTPLNTGWLHIYTDRPNTIFNTPVYTTSNVFSSYSNDLLLRRAGSTKLTLGLDIATFHTNVKVDTGEIFMANGTSNLIRFNSAGVSSPTSTTMDDLGTKIQLWGGGAYAIGIDSGTTWYSSDQHHKWYKAGVLHMQLDGAGWLDVVGGIKQNGQSLDDRYVNATGGVMTGDLKIVKDNPWLSIDSSSSGTNGGEQGAGISIGESGEKGSASLHITYTGDGWSHIGMGAVDTTTNIPQYRAMKMFYQSNNVVFEGDINVGGKIKEGSQYLDDKYVNQSGDTMSGQLKVLQNANTPSLVLEGASSGWASGMQLNNTSTVTNADGTTTRTGRSYGLYANQQGDLIISDNIANTTRLALYPSGNFRVYGRTLANGGLTVEGTSTTLLGGTLGVDGATDLNSTLNVDGVATFNSHVILKGQHTPSSATYGGTDVALSLEHTSGGSSSIYFRSGSNFPSDYGYIRFEDSGDGVGTENARMTIGVENDGGSNDTIQLRGRTVINSQGISSNHPHIVEFQSVGAYKGKIDNSGTLTLVGDISIDGELVSRGSGQSSFAGEVRVPDLRLHSGGAIFSDYNNNYFIKDHANGHITLSATGGDLYLGYLNTTKVRLERNLYTNGGATIVASTNGTLYYQGQNTDERYVNSAGDTMTGFLTLHADPTQPLHAVTKQYVDAVKQSLDIKDSVRATTTENIDLTIGGALVIDGVTTVVGDRVLVKDQTDATQNGIYIVQSGAWTRAEDMDETADISSGAFTFVEEGTKGANMGYTLVSDGVITLGTTPMNFTQFSGAGQVIAGTGIYKTGNELGLTKTGVVSGTYTQVKVDDRGRVYQGLNPTTLGGYGITDAVNKNGDTMSGELLLPRIKFNSYDTSFVTGINGSTIESQYGKSLRFLVSADQADTDGFVFDLIEEGVNINILHTTNTTFTYKGNAVWHSANDGVGSGLDADLLDGLQGTSYMRTDQNTSTTGTLHVGGNLLSLPNIHSQARIQLWSGGAKTIGTEDYHLTFGGTKDYASSTGSKFYSGGDGTTREIVAQIGFGGNLKPENRLNSYFAGKVGIGNSAPSESLDVAGKVLASQGFVVGSVEGSRIHHTSGAYGFGVIDKFAIVHEQGVQNQAIVLAEVASADATNTLFGVAVNDSTGATLSTGNEAGWINRFEVKGNGDTYIAGKLDVVGSIKGDTVTATVFNGRVESRGESHFSVGTYSDPHQGVSYAIKASGGIATDNLQTSKLKSTGLATLSKNAYQVTFTTTDTVTTKTITHNAGTANYMVTVGGNTVKRHIGWVNKLANTVDIEIDDLNLTEDVVVDVIIMPY